MPVYFDCIPSEQKIIFILFEFMISDWIERVVVLIACSWSSETQARGTNISQNMRISKDYKMKDKLNATTMRF